MELWGKVSIHSDNARRLHLVTHPDQSWSLCGKVRTKHSSHRSLRICSDCLSYAHFKLDMPWKIIPDWLNFVEPNDPIKKIEPNDPIKKIEKIFAEFLHVDNWHRNSDGTLQGVTYYYKGAKL